jgi:hypothetical protein
MALTRRYIERTEQSKSYFNPNNGTLYSEVSKVHKLGEAATLKDAIEACDTSVLYILPTPKGKYAHPQSTYPTKPDIKSIDGVNVNAWYGDNAGIVQLGDKQIDILPISRYFDVPVGTYLSDVVLAMGKLKELLNKHFQPAIVHKGTHESFTVELASTPARTGIDLLKRKLPVNAKYHNLPPDIETIIMTQFSQARVELFDHGKDTVAHVYSYDGRWMYASCYRNVPVGEVLHDTVDEYLPYVPGFYRVEVTVPANWHHIGLLPTKNPNPKEKHSVYPNIPGTSFHSWCSYRELKLAMEHEWDIRILERILWPESNAKGVQGKDPLRYWGDTLVEIREKAIQGFKEPIRSMLRDALRHLLLDSVGALHRGKQTIDVYTDSEEDLYDMGYVPENELADGTYHARVQKELTDFQKQQFMPHWTLDIWCKAKEKVTREALKVPYENLMTIRTDGIWVDTPCTFEDTGKVGCFREKVLNNTGPFVWPKNETALRAVMRQAKGEE